MKFALGIEENIVRKGDKRAMMALDRSPESFYPQMNYTFVPLVPTCDLRVGACFDPKGHHMNKIDKGLQGVLHTKVNALSLQVLEKKNFEVGLLCSYVPTCDPIVGSVLSPKESYE